MTIRQDLNKVLRDMPVSISALYDWMDAAKRIAKKYESLNGDNKNEKCTDIVCKCGSKTPPNGYRILHSCELIKVSDIHCHYDAQTWCPIPEHSHWTVGSRVDSCPAYIFARILHEAENIS